MASVVTDSRGDFVGRGRFDLGLAEVLPQQAG